MVAEYPVVSPLLWLRWLLAAGWLVLLPGWLLAGHAARGRLAVPRLALTAGIGLTVAVLWCVGASAIGMRIDPFLYSLTALPVVWAIGRLRPLQAAVARGSVAERPADASAWPRWAQDLGMSIAPAATAWIMVDGFRQACAPPHLHDASNHAFMVWRIVQVHSMRPDLVFGAPYCNHDVPYLLGWHAVTAMIAELAGVSPYIAMWFAAIACCVLIPAALCLLWTEAGLPTLSAALAACFVAANHYVPAGLFSWGGFGALAGMFLLPTLVVLVLGALRNGSLVLGLGAGLSGAALVFVHFSEVVSAAFVAAILAGTVGAPRRPKPRAVMAVAVAALPFLAISSGAMLAGLRPYLRAGVQVGVHHADPLGLVLAQTLMYSSSVKTAIQVLALVGVVWGIWDRRTRALAVGALAVAAACVSLRTVHDPISAFFALAYYGQPARVMYLELFLMPILIAWPIVRIRLWLKRGWQRWVSAALMGAVGAWMIGPSMVHNRDNVRNQRIHVPFDADEYQLALQLRQLVPEGSVVANQPDDGSFWAMHVSGRRFLDPAAWGVGCARRQVPQLLSSPWPAAVLALREQGVEFLYVSDKVLPDVAPPALERSRVDCDPRFEEIARGTQASLYRIQWGEPSRTPEPVGGALPPP